MVKGHRWEKTLGCVGPNGAGRCGQTAPFVCGKGFAGSDVVVAADAIRAVTKVSFSLDLCWL